MTVFECRNCRFRFQAEEASKCPRCDSTEVAEYAAGGHRRTAAATAPVAGSKAGEQPATHPSPKIVREGKEGWMDFHNQQAASCPECGGTQFDLNWKRKEKTCAKCGAVLALPRRFT